MHTQPIITTVAEAESRVVGAQRKSGFAGGLLLLGNSAGHGWRRGESEAWSKSANLLVRLERGGGRIHARSE